MNRPSHRLAVLLVMGMATLLLAGQGVSAASAKPDPGAHSSITNGYSPHLSQWPWMAAVVLTSSPTTDYCGGAVVAPTRILTAAHCVSGDPPSKFQVVVGRRRLSDTTTGQTVSVSRVAEHPQYFKKANGRVVNDVAVLTLSRPVSTPLATIGEGNDWSSSVTVMGWGHVDHMNDIYSDDLLAVDLLTWNDEQCEKVYGADFYSSVNFCAGGNGGHGTCHGDSGGPLMITADQGVSWKLIGVVSWGPGTCLVYGEPGVYAWAAGPALRPWIMSAIAQPAVPVKMSRGQAIADLRYMVKRKTGSRTRRLATNCRRTSAASFSCGASFLANGWGYSGNFQVEVFLAEDGVLRWTGTFKGRRSNGARVRWSI